MRIKIKIALYCITVVFFSCNSQKETTGEQLTQNQKEAFIHFFKVQSYCYCLSHSYENKQIMELIAREDLQGSYDGIAHPVILRKANSLGYEASLGIKPQTYPDFENKKRITEGCLNFYVSKRLDSVARALYQSVHK